MVHLRLFAKLQNDFVRIIIAHVSEFNKFMSQVDTKWRYVIDWKFATWVNMG